MMRAGMHLSAVVGCCLLALLAPACEGAMCHGKPEPNSPQNLMPILTAPPTFVREVANAKLYSAGSGDDTIKVVHLWGTPYEKGHAHGTLLKEEATNMVNAVWDYLLLQVEEAINGTEAHILAPWFIELVSTGGLDVALDATEAATRLYTGSYFYEEMHGMADATGVPFHRIVRIHMIGELTKGSCSMFGAWGNATASMGGGLMQLRALDWDVDGPFKDFPQITVYHPADEKDGHAFANIGWTGWLGSITGFSSEQMAISEIGVTFPDDSFGKESRFGIPFTFILRDILQFDKTREAAQKRLMDAHRTCYLILGVGDGKDSSFRSVEYSHSVAKFFDDTNQEPVYDWHPRIPSVVYHGMDWLCPAFNQVLGEQLQKHHGNITAENTIRDITAIVNTGNLHIAVYDLENMVLHTANARRDGASGPDMAYQRSFVRLDMNALFAVTPSADE